MRYGFTFDPNATYDTLLAETYQTHKVPAYPALMPRRAHMRGFGDQAVTDPNMWANPYSNQPASSPPLVSVSDNNSTAGTVGTAVGSAARGLLNLFQSQQYQQYPPGYIPPQPTPLWVYALIGVGGVVAVGFIARSMRRPRRAVAGYRRRHRR